MADVLVRFDGLLGDDEGRAWRAQACGREIEGGSWEGWIEFEPQDAVGPALRTPRETRQPNYTDLEYWANGLSFAYLQGALERARGAELPNLRPRQVAARPAFEGPAAAAKDAGSHTGEARAILDPFAVYEQGEDVLRDELLALDAGHLWNILRKYDLIEGTDLNLDGVQRRSLAELIVSAVRRQR
jgi:hypothetical protein